jgi:hypothetical protein
VRVRTPLRSAVGDALTGPIAGARPPSTRQPSGLFPLTAATPTNGMHNPSQLEALRTAAASRRTGRILASRSYGRISPSSSTAKASDGDELP